jgi:hypothetical protein
VVQHYGSRRCNDRVPLGWRREVWASSIGCSHRPRAGRTGCFVTVMFRHRVAVEAKGVDCLPMHRFPRLEDSEAAPNLRGRVIPWDKSAQLWQFAKRAIAKHCGRCGRGHRAAGQRCVDPETGERQRFSSTILPAWARKGQFHHRAIGKRPRHTEKSVCMLWSCACTRPIAFVMRGTP